MKKKKEDKTKKEEVCEIFEVEKEGKEKTIKTCGTEEIKEVEKGQIKSENKILKNFFIWIGVFILMFIVVFLITYSTQHFDYKGLKFDIIKDEGGLIFYKTSLPATYAGEKVEYNVYFRKDPRKLEKIPFDGEVKLAEILVYNSTGFPCDGDGVIAIANLAQTFKVLGINVVQDPNAICDHEGRYMYLQALSGNKTMIEKTGPACYNLYVNNCEILDVTEKFMIETLVEIKKIIK
ncbi:hypothetical protein KAJ87_04365 [Candidatus Pacearchaeota archaeon]|nr:hypothetical protein [Candidatus Pacearchaeota archaeon]